MFGLRSRLTLSDDGSAKDTVASRALVGKRMENFMSRSCGCGRRVLSSLV